MGRGRPPPPQSVRSDDFLEFFQEKVSNARRNTANSNPPDVPSASDECAFSAFEPISVETVSLYLRRLPDKHSHSDPIPTWLLKKSVDLLSPFLAELFNRSLSLGTVPLSWKRAHISPILKSPSADPLDVSSYRPISNLPVLSKLLERFVSSQLQQHISKHCLLPDVQSAYRPHHSTETAILKLLSDVLSHFDNGQICLLAFLDLSSAFDCVDHDILSQRLRLSCGLGGAALQWLVSFLSNRTMSVSHVSQTRFVPVTCGVPQGSVLGPLLFSLYTADIARLVHHHGLCAHLFADDIVVYGSTNVKDMQNLSSRLSSCLDDVKSWLNSNRLLLNSAKTKVMWCHSPRRRLSSSIPVRVDGLLLSSDRNVRYLGFTLDANLSLVANVTKTTSACFAMLRRIRSLRRSLTRPLLLTLITSLVLSRLDYCISAHAGLPASTLWHLQRVLHASARLVYGVGRYEHVSPLLRELRWLSVKERIDMRLGTLAFQCQKGCAPKYLSSDLITVSSLPGRERLRSATSGRLSAPRARHPTLGGRAFPIVSSHLWNSLPSSVTHASSVADFKKL